MMALTSGNVALASSTVKSFAVFSGEDMNLLPMHRGLPAADIQTTLETVFYDKIAHFGLD
jgi:hypothetical protein